jgi:hypothetical protein
MPVGVQSGDLQECGIDHVIVEAGPEKASYDHTHGESLVAPDAHSHQGFTFCLVFQPPLPSHKHHEHDDENQNKTRNIGFLPTTFARVSFGKRENEENQTCCDQESAEPIKCDALCPWIAGGGRLLRDRYDEVCGDGYDSGNDCHKVKNPFP